MSYWTTFHRRLSDPEAPGDWEKVAEDELSAVAAKLGPLTATALQAEDGARVLRRALPFYPGHVLYEFVDLSKLPRLPSYLIVGPDGVDVLDWSNRPIYRLNAAGRLALTEDNVVEYLRFFLAHVAGPDGLFVLLEPDELPGPDGFNKKQRETITKHVIPLVAHPRTEPGAAFEIDAVQMFMHGLYSIRWIVREDGNVDFADEKKLVESFPMPEALANLATSASTSPFELHEGWLSLSEVDIEVRDKLKGLTDISIAGKLETVDLAFRHLSFFEDVLLARIGGADPTAGFGLYGLWSSRGLHLLRGRSKDLFEVIQRESFKLDDDTVIDYLKFFCTFVHGDNGPFRIVTCLDDINTTQEKTDRIAFVDGEDGPFSIVTRMDTRQPADRIALSKEKIPVDFERVPKSTLETILRDVTVGERSKKGLWPARAMVQYSTQLFIADFKISGNGEVMMTDDETIVNEIPADKRRDKILLPSVIAATITGPAEFEELLDAASQRSNWPAYLSARELESSVMRECIRVQLVHALRCGHGAPLFEAPPDADDEALLVAFAHFLFEVHPVVVIESRTVYIERLVSALLVDRVEYAPKFKTVGVSPYGAGEGIIGSLNDGDFWQISMHEWYSIRRPEAVAHQLGTTNSVTVIGCDAQSAIPEPLRRVTDVVIVLDDVGADLFKTTFCRIFNCEWPDSGDEANPLWQRYVTPGDFYQPVRDMLQRRADEADDEGWSAEGALEAIRARVLERLSPIGAEGGPRLDEIHGLGEARQVLLDLIEDMKAAVKGEIPWDAMDRGLLMIGEPGTGKTMLARAMARDCGVRFIQGSQAQWMVGTEHLGQHIREIRATFAEARRYAPSILFIDELDSIGNRELFEGRNRQYCVEVVNALLQEIQGVYEREGVFVIGATNYLTRVDPALTRAGRLDQVVHLRRPNRKALTEIFKFHLREAMDEGRLDDDVDCHTLAALAMGSTGADVELFVRDAARRARKEGSAAISQRHLAAAITRAPRTEHSTRAVAPEQQARTAVHEAGHALAMLLCEHYPTGISMISIIPRSDGSLGFTGFIPDERTVFTRREYQEYLQVLLAGRAAEELQYGADGVSSGAGGSSGRNDLALASKLASNLVCQFGMGEGATLRWQERAAAQEDIAAINGLLDRAYREVLEKLTAHRPLLETLRDRLTENHEIFAPEVYQLAEDHGLVGRGQSATGDSGDV